MLFSNVEQVEQIIEHKSEQNELTSSAVMVWEKTADVEEVIWNIVIFKLKPQIACTKSY